MTQLLDSQLWWRGPSWLQESEADWPSDLRSQTSNDVVEVERKSRASITCVAQPKRSLIDFARFDKYGRLLRTVAWIRRFTRTLRSSQGR